MFSWAIGFFILAIVAAILGFGGIAGTAAEFAKILFVIGIVLFAISSVAGIVRGRRPPRA